MTTGGRVLKIVLTPGQRHDSIKAKELLEAARGKALLGDTAYDSNEFIDAIRAKGMEAVVHPHPRRVWHVLKLDRKKYRRRYLVECFFHHLKRFRAVATRYDKTACCYLGIVQVACLLLNL